ncbi:MAG: hypothetical protein HC893_17230 [Chloroflexaceae bacterium]|nr:hypothetical protein [Chloroflexaceae bacterium]
MVQDIWRQLAQRYDWQMVGSADEIAFVRQVQAELAAHSAGPLTTPLIRQAVYRIYSEYLYRGLLAGHEQAAAELRRVCWLAARKRVPTNTSRRGSARNHQPGTYQTG